MNPIQNIGKMIRPIERLFWGALLCITEITFTTKFNGVEMRLDLLNDLFGMLMITSGVFTLARFHVHQRYATAMRVIKIVAVLGCMQALHNHFIYDVPAVVSTILSVLSAAQLISIAVFCMAMHWLCTTANLHATAKSWLVSTKLFVGIYLTPLTIFFCAKAIGIVKDTHASFDPGPAGLILLPVLFAPAFHLFVSTHRMRMETEKYHLRQKPA